MADASAQVPNRMEIANLRTGEVVSAQFNPEELKETLQVNYERLEILGMSHQPLQYKNTGNLQIAFDLGFDALSSRNVELSGTAVGGGDPHLMRRYLLSLCYPPRGPQDVLGGGPPTLLFMWPHIWTVHCKMTKLDITHKRFALSGIPTLFVATVTIEQISESRIFAEDVLSDGTLRSGAGPGA